MRRNTKRSAVLLMTASAGCFSAMQLCSSLCAPIPAMEQIFFRNIMSLAMYALVWKKGISVFGTRRQQPLLWAWSICGCLNVVFLFIAAKTGDQGSLMIIGRTSGFLVVILAALILRERVGSAQYFAVLLAIGGGVLTAAPGGGLAGDGFTFAMAALSSLFSALASICLGLLKNKVHALTVAIHFSAVSLLVSIPFLLADYVRPVGLEWVYMAGIGLFGALGQLTQMWAFERALVGEINIYGYSGILFSMLFGLLFLGEPVTAPQAVGGCLVIGAGVWSYLAARHPRQQEQTEGHAVT